jgi:putative aldouronate transport system substrate-binding protein
MIEYNWYEFTGGPNKAINEEYIIVLNELIDKYSPNLKKVFADNPEYEKMVKTDDGKFYVIYIHSKAPHIMMLHYMRSFIICEA